MQALLADFEVKRAAETQEELSALTSYWDSQKDPALRDTFDLSDPRALRKEMPARVGDDDPRCGPASLQKFDGEDLQYADRVKLQQKQMAEWHAAQTAEREAQKVDEKNVDMEWARLNIAVDDIRLENERKAAVERQRFNEEYMEANRALTMEKTNREVRSKRVSAAAEARELEAMRQSTFINELRDKEQSMLGGHRVRPDHMKGFTQDQLDAIRNEQLRQQQEKLEQNRRAAEDEALWAENQQAMYAAMQQAEVFQAQEKHEVSP